MRLALPASLALHGGLLAAAWVLLGMAPPAVDTGLASISVEVIATADFASATDSKVQSSATESMVSAGSVASEQAEAAEPPAETVEVATAEVPPLEAPEAAKAEVTETKQTTATDAEAAKPPSDAEAAEPAELSTRVEQPADSLPVLASTADATEPEPVASATEPEPVAPSATQAEAQEVTAATEAQVQPAETVQGTIVDEPAREATSEKPIDKQVETPAKKTPKKKAPKEEQKQASSGGNGGESEADAAASAASAAKGKADAAGNAAVSKYPGLVQAKLRRALRFPRGAGNARGEALVQFVVAASGAVSGISVVRSSGHAVLDTEAIATVKRAAPFPKIPADAGRTSWTFTTPLLFAR